MKLFYHLLVKILKLSVFIFFLFVAISFITSNLILDEDPHIKEFEEIKIKDILRIKSIIEGLSFQINNEDEKEIEISQRDINLLINQFGKNIINFPKDSFFKVNLEEENAVIKLTIPMIEANYYVNNWFKKNQIILIQKIISIYQNMINEKFLNLKIELKINNKLKKEKWLHVNKIKIGDIKLSKNITESISSYLMKKILSNKKSKPILEAWNNITDIEKINNKIKINYIFKKITKSSLNNLSDLIINSKEKEKVIFYERYIQTLSKQGRLITFISRLFSKASERSLENSDPTGENKSLLIAMAKFYGGDNILSLTSKEKKIIFNDNNHTIYGRSDLTRYFIITAGLSLLADQGSFELRSFKEQIINFSYSGNINAWQILASRAGIRLAENATRSPASAFQVQKILSNLKSDTELMPDLGMDFSYSNDVFSLEDIEELSEIIDIYLEQYYIFKK